jgi:hypothetical protein
VPLLAAFFSIEVAGHLFLGLVILMILSATMALHYAVHRVFSFWPLLAGLFIYNRVFLWGFLNYLFGLGLMLWLLAAWIYYADRPLAKKAAAFILPALALYFAHLAAFGLYALGILGFELSRLYRSQAPGMLRNLGPALFQFVLPGVLFLFFSPTAGTALLDIHYGNILRRLGAVVYPVLNYHPALDIGTSLFLTGLLGAGIYFRKIHLSKNMYLPLILVLIAFWLLPMNLFTAHRLELRMAVALPFLITAATLPVNISRRQGVVLALVVIALFSGRMGLMTSHWVQAQGVYGSYLKAFEKIEPGGKLFSAFVYPGSWKPFPLPLTHLPCLALIKRNAFVPTLFAYPSQQPVRLAPEYEKLVKPFENANYEFGARPDLDRITKNFDYFLIAGERHLAGGPALDWPVLYQGEDFRLLKIPK